METNQRDAASNEPRQNAKKVKVMLDIAKSMDTSHREAASNEFQQKAKKIKVTSYNSQDRHVLICKCPEYFLNYAFYPTHRTIYVIFQIAHFEFSFIFSSS